MHLLSLEPQNPGLVLPYNLHSPSCLRPQASRASQPDLEFCLPSIKIYSLMRCSSMRCSVYTPFLIMAGSWKVTIWLDGSKYYKSGNLTPLLSCALLYARYRALNAPHYARRFQNILTSFILNVISMLSLLLLP